MNPSLTSPGGDHHNVFWQPGVDRQRQPLHRNGGGGAEIGDVDLGMNARVGTPRSGTFDRMAHHGGQGVLEGLLDGDSEQRHSMAVASSSARRKAETNSGTSRGTRALAF